MSRNPKWTRDELILGLDLYFRLGRTTGELDTDEIRGVSELLNSLGIHKQDLRKRDFRNQHGVRMKLANFMAVDPEHPAQGLTRGSKLDKLIWDEFSNDIPKLRKIAIAIQKGHLLLKNTELENDEEEEEFLEGKVLTKVHKYKERNSKVVQKKKQAVLQKEKKLICEVCDFDFAQIYGPDLGYGFAECHHIIPLSQLAENHKTRIEDLAIICSNCHRIIHRSKLAVSVQNLRKIVKEREKCLSFRAQ